MNNDKFGSDHYKKQSNSLFGKQIEYVESYRDTKLANDLEKPKKFALKITLKDWKQLDENVILHMFNKPDILYDKPIMIGFLMLEIAKYEMKIIYDRLKQTF